MVPLVSALMSRERIDRDADQAAPTTDRVEEQLIGGQTPAKRPSLTVTPPESLGYT